MKKERKIKYISILLIIILAVVLSNCSAKYEYVPTTNSVKIYNSTEASSDWTDCFKYSTDHADYYFETTLKDKQKIILSILRNRY